MDKMKLLEELKQRIMSHTGVQDEEQAAEIARKWAARLATASIPE